MVLQLPHSALVEISGTGQPTDQPNQGRWGYSVNAMQWIVGRLSFSKSYYSGCFTNVGCELFLKWLGGLRLNRRVACKLIWARNCKWSARSRGGNLMMSSNANADHILCNKPPSLPLKIFRRLPKPHSRDWSKCQGLRAQSLFSVKIVVPIYNPCRLITRNFLHCLS